MNSILAQLEKTAGKGNYSFFYANEIDEEFDEDELDEEFDEAFENKMFGIANMDFETKKNLFLEMVMI